MGRYVTMMFDDEIEEFRQWRAFKLNQSPLEKSFEDLERILDNPFLRGYDSAFRLMAKCIKNLKEEIEK
jgi:hypothetical protein